MHQAFDKIANGYDDAFTQSLIGKAQREIVWNYLEKSLPQQKKINVLELNGGTGEDAIRFAEKGHKVLTTDISDKMIDIIKKKIDESNMTSRIRSLQLDIREIKKANFEERFDLIFSNFGGINCITIKEINNLPKEISKILKPDGRIILIIMPKYCFWETIYFLFKLNLRNAFRRYSDNGTIAKLDGYELKTFYYSPTQIIKIFSDYFTAIAVKPVGFFIPPSYLEKFFVSKSKFFNRLKKLENLITNQKYLAGFADHYLIDLRVKE